MGQLIYSMIVSLDGYVNDAAGSFDWAAPDEEVHQFVNDFERPVGTYLYGRRMYEVMAVWEDPEMTVDGSPAVRDFAGLWQAAEKVVYSSTLQDATTARTRIEPSFDPAAVRRMKETADRDLSVGGPGLAAHAIRAGLVDEYRVLVVPEVVGGGTRALPDGVRLELALVEERRFGSGVLSLRYRVRA